MTAVVSDAQTRNMRADTVAEPDSPTTITPSAGRSRCRCRWRTRWAAIGAAVAVALGGGTLHLAGAAAGDPSSIIAITPARILDTRDPVDLGLDGPFVSAVGLELQVTGPVPTSDGTVTVVPAGATGVLLNVTVVGPTAAGFISVRPAGTPGPPQTSSLNFEAGDITPNAVFVALPTTGPDVGRIEVTYDAFGIPGPTTDVLGDVVGYTLGAPVSYTKAEADNRFLTGDDAYTKTEVDNRFLTGDDAYTKAEVDDRRAVFAVVNEVGDLERGRDVVLTEKVPSPPSDPGHFNVTFGRDVSGCSYQATTRQPGFATAEQIGTAGTLVTVRTHQTSGTEADRSFSLTVHC